MGSGRSKMIGVLWIGFALLLAALAVVGIPLLAKSTPWSFETKLASFVGDFDDFRPCRTPEGLAAFQKIVHRLHPILKDDAKLPITVEVVEQKIVNAFASLGGKIYVFSGLIRQAETPEELAAVIAHEMEHVRERHVLQGVMVRVLTVEAVDLALGKTGTLDPKLVQMLLNMRFSREQEAEADYQGLQRLRAAKVDVSGYRRFFERMENETSVPAIVSDHPSSESRAEAVREFEGGPIQPLLSPAEWQAVKQMCQAKSAHSGR